MTRLVWQSPNGKYKVLVKKEGLSPVVGFWKIHDGKQKDIRFKDLPQYVKKQIKLMKDSL